MYHFSEYFPLFICHEQAIAVHTFCVLVLRWRAPKFISKLVVLMIWIFAALVIGIPNIIHMNERYYGNTGYCKSYFLIIVHFLTKSTF